MRVATVILLLSLTSSPAGLSRAAILPPVALGASDLAQAKEYVNASIKGLPSWLAAAEARFEQPELQAIQQDTDDCLTAVDEATFLKAVQQLKCDWGKLIVLDTNIQREIYV